MNVRLGKNPTSQSEPLPPPVNKLNSGKKGTAIQLIISSPHPR